MTDAGYTAIVAIVAAVTGSAAPTIMAFAAWRKSKEASDKTGEVASAAKVAAKVTDALAVKTDLTVAQNARLLEKSDEAVVKTEELVKKTEEIHTQTNGNLTKLTTALAVADERIAGLEKMVAVLIVNKKNGANGQHETQGKQ